MTTAANGDVLLMTYFIGESSRGCLLYHLNGPNPTEGRLVLPTDSTPQPVILPMEDGSVLLVTRTVTQVIVGRLSPGSYEYEELGRFIGTEGASFASFRTISAFVEPDQAVHLAATTQEERFAMVTTATVQRMSRILTTTVCPLSSSKSWAVTLRCPVPTISASRWIPV